LPLQSATLLAKENVCGHILDDFVGGLVRRTQ